MKTKEIEEQINALKEKVNSIYEQLSEEIWEICEKLEYQDSSRFSYNIDNFERFKNYLNEFEILKK